MKTICVDARLLGCGGIGTYIDNLFYYLKKTSLKIFALVHKNHLLSYRQDWDCIEPIVVDAPIYSLKEQCILPRKIPSCDLFWSAHYNIPLFPIKARKRMTTIHDVYHLAFYHLLTPLEKLYANQMIRAAVRYSDRIITVSHFSKTELKKHIGVADEKIEVIYSGVNHRGFQEKGVTQTFPALPDKFLLFVGSLKPHKNLKNLLKAFAMLSASETSDLHLVIIGKNEGLKHVEDRAALLLNPALEKQIHFLENVSDAFLSNAYQKAVALIFPSFYEGFGFPPIEAMRFGCPVIVSHLGSLPEVCGDSVVYIDPHSPQEILCAIREMIENPLFRHSLKIKGEEQSHKYDWKNCADAHLTLIEKLVNR